MTKNETFLMCICLFACLMKKTKHFLTCIWLFGCTIDHKTSLAHGFVIFPLAKNARLLNYVLFLSDVERDQEQNQTQTTGVEL